MDAKRNSSFAAKLKKRVRNMRSTFNILFYVNILSPLVRGGYNAGLSWAG
jgi:fatty acid-binding protein DegV